MVTRPPIAIAVARFEDLVARGLQGLIGEDESLRIVAADVAQAELPAVLRTTRPDVAILNFGALKTASEIRALHIAHPSTRLLVLANRPTPADSAQILAFGATACLAKSTQARDVLTAIHLASRGLQVLPEANGGPPPSSGPDLVTAREAEVLDLLRRGRSNAEIASALNVSIETVRTHARHIYRKLGVRTRRELRLGA
jgi:DNA-binding NarL/FixJ family response regulator